MAIHSSDSHPQQPVSAPDRLYAQPRKDIDAFAFNEAVVNVFPDMIRRSVPGYDAVLSMVGILAKRFAQPHSVLYDLGCSLGATTRAIQNGLEAQARASSYRIVAVDNAPAMIDRFKEFAEAEESDIDLDIRLGDVREVPIVNASLVVLNYTLQFIDLEERLPLLSGIREGMLPGGALLLSEKIAFEDEAQQSLYTELHHAFKRANGYSALEISQKRTALEHVLIPETLSAHEARLRDAGFASSRVWFQCLNFSSILALV